MKHGCAKFAGNATNVDNETLTQEFKIMSLSSGDKDAVYICATSPKKIVPKRI